MHLLSGCDDRREPILRGAKQELDKIFQKLEQTESDLADEREEDDFDSEVAPEGEALPENEHTETVRKILNLNLPDEVKHGDLFSNTEPQWRKHAVVGEQQTFPNFFEHQVSDNKKASAVDFSGKLHWDEKAEVDDLTIPPLNTIEGLELEISVKTR